MRWDTTLRHYRNHFKGKVVLCNCDDPYESNSPRVVALSVEEPKGCL